MTFQKGHKINVGSKRVGDKPDSVKRAKWIEDAVIIEKLKVAREMAIDEMEKKIGKASYRDVVDSVDKTTKNIQLLSGKSTENINHTDNNYGKAAEYFRKGSSSDNVSK